MWWGNRLWCAVFGHRLLAFRPPLVVTKETEVSVRFAEVFQCRRCGALVEI
jgi:hypothetical protein